ncbi:MAG: hypothetical protein AB7V62_00970 [Thermoleophilia bacterium]
MRSIRRTAIAGALAVGIGLTGAASASGAGLDDTFGLDGVVVNPLSGDSDRYLNATRAPGGGTYNVGYTTASGTDRAFLLTKVDASGELDDDFGTNGVVTLNVVTGPFAAPPAGATPSGSAEVARGVVVQPDGKIVVAGQAETPPAAGKPDSRDIDIYVARFEADGDLDGTFGTGGITRVDLSDGVTPVPATVNTDQAYGLNVRPDGTLVVVAARGQDTAAPARTDRDLALVQLTPGGVLDPAFTGQGGGTGVAIAPTPGLNENPRQAHINADGSAVAVGYGSVSGGPVRPYIAKFGATGTLDASFGTGGIATGDVGGPAPGFAEAYEIAPHNGGYVLTGYGSRSTTPANGIDVVVYRFSGTGQYDTSFGQNGLVTYNRVNGADRGRDMTILRDGRIVVVGSSATADATPNLDGLVLVLNADGTPDTSVSPTGAIVKDLGGQNDAFFGVTTVSNGTKVVAAGYRGGATAAGDESVLVRVDLPTPPPAAAAPAPASPAPPATPAPVVKAPTAAPRPKLATLVRGGKVYLRITATLPKTVAGRTLVVQRRIKTRNLTVTTLKVPASGKVSKLVRLRPGTRSGALGVRATKSIRIRATLTGTATARPASSAFRTVKVATVRR